MGDRPYKIVADEPSMASVIDRASGQRIGYVLQGFYGTWEAFLSGNAGNPIVVRWILDDRLPLLPFARTGHKSRADAAQHVHDTWTEIVAHLNAMAPA